MPRTYKDLIQTMQGEKGPGFADQLDYHIRDAWQKAYPDENINLNIANLRGQFIGFLKESAGGHGIVPGSYSKLGWAKDVAGKLIGGEKMKPLPSDYRLESEPGKEVPIKAPIQQPQATPTTAPKSGSYTIQPGDTLSQLAQRYGTTIQELMRLNPQVSDPNLIYAGAQLSTPGQKTTTPQAGQAPVTPQTPLTAPPKINFRGGLNEGQKQNIRNLMLRTTPLNETDARNYAYATGESNWQKFIGLTPQQVQAGMGAETTTPTAGVAGTGDTDPFSQAILDRLKTAGADTAGLREQLAQMIEGRTDSLETLKAYEKEAGLPDLKERYQQFTEQLGDVEKQIEDLPEEIQKRTRDFVVNASQLGRITAKEALPLSKLFNSMSRTLTKLNTSIGLSEKTVDRYLDANKEDQAALIEAMKVRVDAGEKETTAVRNAYKDYLDLLKTRKTLEKKEALSSRDVKAADGKTYKEYFDPATPQTVVYKKDMGYTYKPTDSDKEKVSPEEKAFKEDIKYFEKLLDKGEKEWSEIFNIVKAKYPYFTNEEINQLLGGGIPYEKGKFITEKAWGRAKEY